MARIAGVDLPNKAVKIALTYIYGIGRKSADDICKKTNIDPDVRINTLSSDELALLRKVISAPRSPSTSRGLWTSAATEDSGTGRACRSEGRGQRPTPGPGRAGRRLSPIRRSNGQVRNG